MICAQISARELLDFVCLINNIINAFPENTKTDMIFFLHNTCPYVGYSSLLTNQYHTHEGTVAKNHTTGTLIIMFFLAIHNL